MPALYSQAEALVFIHKRLRDAVILAGMPESSHMDVKVRQHQITLNNGRSLKATIHGTGYPLPGGYDELPGYLCITIRAGAWELAQVTVNVDSRDKEPA